MLESLFNKVTDLRACNFVKQRRFFPVNIPKFLRTFFVYRTPLGAAFVKRDIKNKKTYALRKKAEKHSLAYHLTGL